MRTLPGSYYATCDRHLDSPFGNVRFDERRHRYLLLPSAEEGDRKHIRQTDTIDVEMRLYSIGLLVFIAGIVVFVDQVRRHSGQDRGLGRLGTPPPCRIPS